MRRDRVVRWLKEHPEAVRGDPEEIVARCERAVRRHAREDAWLAARDYVSERRHDWEEGVGAHASEVYVAREVCNDLAYELRRHEPGVAPDDADHLAGGPVKEALARDGWEFLVPWILELAREEEHATWREIVRYTGKRPGRLIESRHLSNDHSFDRSRCFDEIAVEVARILERDFATHAFPR